MQIMQSDESSAVCSSNALCESCSYGSPKSILFVVLVLTLRVLFVCVLCDVGNVTDDGYDDSTLISIRPG